jgi:hypothetical protein
MPVGKCDTSQVRAAVIIAARFAASSDLSLSTRITGGGRYLSYTISDHTLQTMQIVIDMR